MKPIIQAIFRPVANRHYTNKKTSAVLYAFEFFPVLLVGLYGAIFVDSFFWFVLGGIIIYGFIDYIVFDAFIDRLGWKLIWHHFYSDEAKPHTPEQDLIKQYEQNPTPENYEALQKHLRVK